MDNFIPSANPKRLNPLEPGVDEQTRSTLLKLLLQEAEKSCVTCQRLDTIDRHMAGLRQLIYRQVELVEKSKLQSHDAERVQNLLAMMNNLMADYQALRRRISPVAE